MKVSEVNKNLFKDNLSIYLSKDREFQARKEKAVFSESLNLFEQSGEKSSINKPLRKQSQDSDFEIER